MRPRWLRNAANAVVVLSLADGAFSLADELLRAATGIAWLGPLRGTLAAFVFAAMLLMLVGMALTPRLPLRVFLPLTLGTLWLNLGAAPLGMWLAPSALSITGCAIQLALSVDALAAIRRHNAGRAWLFDAASPGAPRFAWSRSLGFAGTTLFVGLPVFGLYLVVALATAVQQTTEGFVAFDLAGVSLGDRRYARGDQEIRLVGMMHIGEEAAYRQIVESFAQESTVVLAEGLTDRDGLLSATLEYGHAAEALGLARQQDLREYLVDPEDPDAAPPDWPEIRHADVDASAFAPETLAWLRWASGVWSAPDLASALSALVASVEQSNPEQLAAFQRDVLDLRNAHLIGELDAVLGDYRRVVVPWGALHLPAIERAVAERGFEETSRAQHPLLSWSTIAAALL
jgi:hypothetical protein